jgi:hypothetical protein
MSKGKIVIPDYARPRRRRRVRDTGDLPEYRGRRNNTREILERFFGLFVDDGIATKTDMKKVKLHADNMIKWALKEGWIMKDGRRYVLTEHGEDTAIEQRIPGYEDDLEENPAKPWIIFGRSGGVVGKYATRKEAEARIKKLMSQKSRATGKKKRGTGYYLAKDTGGPRPKLIERFVEGGTLRW